MLRARFLLPILLASCAAPLRPPPSAPEPAQSKSEVEAILAGLERSFYSHWGAVEATPEYARLREGSVPLLRGIADANGEHALMALRVLARRAPQEEFSPEARAILYAAAFTREHNFVRWGVISPSGFLPGVYGVEFIRLGETAAPYLKGSLRDTRRARVECASGEPVNRAQGDRVCDYAWVFLAQIFDRPLAYHADPLRRDPQIRELETWLDRRRR